MDPTLERILDEIRPFLTEARKGILSNEDEEYLRILTDLKRNLVNLQETGECDHATLKNICQAVLYGDYICLKNMAAVFTQKVNEVKEAESKGMPEILQPKIREIKGYFAKLCELIKNMDNLVKKINNKINDFNERECKQLTEKEKNEVKFLNIDFETGVKKTADYFKQADRVLKMLEVDVASYKKKHQEQAQKYAGYTTLAAMVIGGVVGGVVGAAMGAFGGNTSGNSSNAIFHLKRDSALTYSNEFLQYKSYALPCIVGATVAITGIGLSLAMLWKGWVAKRNVCDKLLLILRDYRDLIDKSQRISLQSV